MHPDNLILLRDEYIQSLHVRNLAKRTIEARNFMLEKFFDYLQTRGTARIDSISKGIILDYQTELYHTINKRGRPNSVTYQNSMLSAVKGFMRFLKDRDYIVRDPSLDIPYGKVPKQLPRGILTTTEARRIMTTPDTTCALGYRDRTILEVLYTTGIRKQELNNLSLVDVDYHDGFLRIDQGKGGKDRIVPLGKIACRYLESTQIYTRVTIGDLKETHKRCHPREKEKE